MNPIEEFPTAIFQTVSNSAYLTFFSPILIAYRKKEGAYFNDPKRYQKILVVLSHLLVLLTCCSLLLQILLKAKTVERVTFWTDLLTHFSWQSYLISTMYTFWFKQEEILVLINQIRRTCIHLRQSGFTMIRKPLIVLLKVLLPASSFAYSACVMVSFYLYPLHRNGGPRTNDSSTGGVEIASTGDSFYDCICYLLFCITFVYTTLGYGVLLGVSATLWLTIDGFVKGLKKRTFDFKNIKIILDIMVDMSKTFEACSGAFDILFAQQGLSLIPCLAVQLYSAFAGGQDYLLLLIFNTILFSSILMLAAGCHAKLTSVQTWVYHAMSCRSETIPYFMDDPLRFPVSLLMNQINEKQFGISGVFFMITYEFVGSVCGLVITYALVLSQLQPHLAAVS